MDPYWELTEYRDRLYVNLRQLLSQIDKLNDVLSTYDYSHPGRYTVQNQLDGLHYQAEEIQRGIDEVEAKIANLNRY